MKFLDDKCPWGSPTVASIPLPPFSNDAEHRRYVRMLQLHLALLDDGAPSLPTIALSLALEPPAHQAFDNDGSLTPLELAVSLTSWFPAPWTPDLLARSLARSHQYPPVFDGRSWRWLYDPDFTATPNRGGGGWKVTRHERGDRVVEQLADDRDLVVLWVAMFRAKFGFPLAHGYDAADLAALAPASVAVSMADTQDAAFAYRTTWREARDAALTAAHPSSP